jgi:hypothetical protein
VEPTGEARHVSRRPGPGPAPSGSSNTVLQSSASRCGPRPLDRLHRRVPPTPVPRPTPQLHLDDTQIQDLRDEIEAKDEALREARQQYETLQETYQEAAATLEAKTREFEELTARLEAAGWTDYTRDKEAETGRYRELLCRREQLQVRQYRERAVYHVQLWPLDDESARGARVPSTLQREHGAFLAEGPRHTS